VQLRSLNSSEGVSLLADPVGRLVEHELDFPPGETLSFWPGSGDCLYQRHPERCEVSGSSRVTMTSNQIGQSKRGRFVLSLETLTPLVMKRRVDDRCHHGLVRQLFRAEKLDEARDNRLRIPHQRGIIDFDEFHVRCGR
jgi:hypothetical protein